MTNFMAKVRNLKIFLLLAGAGLLAILGVLSYFAYRVSNIKGPLISTLQSEINGKLKIGSANVVFFPTGVDLRDIRLYAPGEKQPSASIREARLRFKLIPLIQKKIETSLTLEEPQIILHQRKHGPSNMEEIFSPLLAGNTKGPSNQIDRFWWKRIAINRLKIRDAYFKATREGSAEISELKNLSVNADNIRFESISRPADINITYTLPYYSKIPMELATKIIFEEKDQALRLQNGTFRWGPAKMDVNGLAYLPTDQQKEITLNLNFSGKNLPTGKIMKNLKDPLPLSGNISLKGTVTGSPFAPALSLVMDAPELNLKNQSLNQFHGEISKSGKPIKIKNTAFQIYRGTVGIQGEILPEGKMPTRMEIDFKNLSMEAITGDTKNPARLSGDLSLKSSDLEDVKNYMGDGDITLGPIPIPPVNLRDKVRIAEILSAGMGLNRMVNVGLLSNSADVLGTQIDVLRAKVFLEGENISLKPFNLANNHFSASGNATVHQQKDLNGEGTFILSPGVTQQLILDPLLRSTLTKGNGGLRVPFSLSGPVQDPQVSVDSHYLQGQMAKAALVVLQKNPLGTLQPQRLLNQALKGTTLENPNHPLGQILGSAKPPSNPTPTPSSSKSNTGSNQADTGKKSPLEQLLFGK